MEEYTKIDDSTIGQVNVVAISINDLLAQKQAGLDMIAEGQKILDDANFKIEKAASLGISTP